MITKTLTVALVGNPNAGKTTLFNALSGLRQRVGNYPGVTVELKKGQFSASGLTIDLVDLPGTYSLAARSPDEMVAVDLLLGRRPEEPRPDVVLSIVDAVNLDRHLYLTSQLLDLGEPVVLAVNMMDAAKAHGITIDCQKLSAELGIPVVPIQANKGIGLDALTKVLLEAAESGSIPRGPTFPAEFEKEVTALQEELRDEVPAFLTRRLLLDISGHCEQWLVGRHGSQLRQHLDSARQRLAEAGFPVPAVEARTRYGWIRPIVAAAVKKPAVRPVTWTDRLDAILTHRVWGTLVFLAVMFAVFESIFVLAKPLMESIDAVRELAAKSFEGILEPGPLRSLLSDGVIKGVGSVLVFLPQILILFAFIAILEDCGYMARAAFLMDRLMSRCGLSGKSFIPMLSSVACAVPGILATRVIENRRDRLATILVAPLMSCSARLPVYSLLIGTFLTDGQPFWVPGLVLFCMYLLGFILAPLVALLLKRTLLRGATPVFVMELPAYKRPTLRNIVRRMWDAGYAFVARAGKVILAAMIIVWALLYFPNTDANGVNYEELISREAEPSAEVKTIQGEWKRNSILGRIGRWMEPAFAPLGWDWKIGTATLASFPAREVIVGMLGMIYDVGDEPDEDGSALQDAVRKEWAGDPIRGRYGIPVALSIMVFFALCMQCASTLIVMQRETKSWKMPAFAFAYMTALAYVGALVTFQLGRLIVDAL
ncbi:MAG TPA: ferrous iron transport protein B [Urbifossiella sp.]|nr:ferrous iron transport protein B [Urbifossiella sp.]